MQTIFRHEIWASALTLILTSLIIMGSPGPSTVSATAVGVVYGFRRSLAYVAGLVLGTTAVLIAVAAGVVAILLSIPHGSSVLMAISTVYIIYLSVRIAMAPPPVYRGGQGAAPAFGGGFLLAIANPKAYLAIASVFAGTTLFGADHALDAAAKTALLGVMIIIIHLFWLTAGASLSRFLTNPVGSRIVNVGLAVILIITTGLALWR